MNFRKLFAACVLASPFFVGSLPIFSAIAKADTISNLSSVNQRPRLHFKRVCDQEAPGKVRCHSLIRTQDDLLTPMVSNQPEGYGPDQFHTAYQLPKTAARPTTIAIVDAYDSPTIENDLKVYSQTYKLPACTTANGCFKKVNQYGQQGSYPPASASWAGEIALDVEVAHAICQNCKILLVEAKSTSFTDLIAAEDMAAKSGATVISNSWGSPEASGETKYDSHFNRPGIAITASSGDDGYGVLYPAASPYVTAVGGTTLELNSNNTRKSETTWKGAGSGCSAYEPKPYWQMDTGCHNRTVADVAAVADPYTGAAVYNTTGSSKGWTVIGGTSLAAPLIAGVYALSGNASSVRYGSYPYSHTLGLFDVKSGSNKTNNTSCSNYLCTAGSGYDGPTGLGSPNGIRGF
jgi:subtilase family serine protease